MDTPSAPPELVWDELRPILDEELPNLRKLDALGRMVADLVAQIVPGEDTESRAKG